DVHRLRRLPQARHEPLRPRRLPQPRRHRRHGPLRPPLREASEAQDDAAHLPQDHGARRARACARPEHVLPRREADVRDLRLGAGQHPPRHHVPAGPRPEDGEAEAPEPPQPGQGGRHGLHRRRRRADDPLPRPGGAVPVVRGSSSPPRPRGGGGEPEQRLLAQRHLHDHRQLPVLVRLLHPPVEHAAELPCGADADDSDLLPGLGADRRRGARGGAPRHERLGHWLRHPPLHRRLLRNQSLPNEPRAVHHSFSFVKNDNRLHAHELLLLVAAKLNC
ncbi:Nodulin protein, partial [Zea mays]